MKNNILNNTLLLSSILFFSACATNDPKITKKSLSAYNIMGIEQGSTQSKHPLFVIKESTPKSNEQALFTVTENPPENGYPFIITPPTSQPRPQRILPAEPIATQNVHYHPNPPSPSIQTLSPTPIEEESSIEVVSYGSYQPPVVPEPSYQPPVISSTSYQSPIVTPPPYQPPVITKPPYQTYTYKKNKISQEIESNAKSFLGTKYVWGATGPSKFDCSGFTQWIYRDAGIKIPRVSRDQAKVGKYVRYEDLKQGDMVFFDTKKKRSGKVTHVGIYLGDGNFIHASSGAKKVVIYNFDEKPYYKDRFLWGRRVIQENNHFASN